MKKMFLALSCAALMVAVAGCNNRTANDNMADPQKQEREFMKEAIRHRSPDVQRVDIIDNTLVYTHIYDGIVAFKVIVLDIIEDFGFVVILHLGTGFFQLGQALLRGKQCQLLDDFDLVHLYGNGCPIVKLDLRHFSFLQVLPCV